MILKVINLPRQARDKHRKSTQKRCVFLQENVDSMLMSWEERMRPVGWGRVAALSQGVMLVLELTISDARKPLLLANPGYVPYLVDSLLLDPKHPRAGLADEEKIWLQSMHTECLAQLALFPPGKARLLEDSSVISALEAVAVRGLSQEAQESAGKVRKRGLGPRFILKLIILPRQARDKHGQDSKKTIVFSQALMALRTSQRDSTGTSGGGGSNSIEQRRGESPNAGEEKTPFLLPFDCGERSFCQDRLGTVAIKKLTQTKRWLLSPPQ